MAPRKAKDGKARGRSRRESLRLFALALAAPALLSRGGRAQDAGAAAAGVSRQGAAATGGGAAGPWPSAEKLQQTNADNVAALKKVALGNGDAPDALPRPPLPGAGKGPRR
jgi:hypothetical protein